MKNIVKKFIALLVVLTMLLTSVGALAESYDTTSLKIGSFTLTMGDTSYPIDASLVLDLGFGQESGAPSGALSALAGANTALRGGFSFDGTNVLAGLDGMDKSIALPLEKITAMAQSVITEATGEGGLDSLSAGAQSCVDLITYASSSEALMNGLPDLLKAHLTDGYSAEATYDLDNGTQLNGQSYDIAFTHADIAALYDDIAALDPTFAEKLTNVLGTNLADAMKGATDEMTADGTLFYDEAGDLALNLDIVAAEDDGDGEKDTFELPLSLLVLNGEDASSVSLFTIFSEGGDTTSMSLDMTLPTTENGDFTVYYAFGTLDDDNEGQNVTALLDIPSDPADYNVQLLLEITDKYMIDDQMYESPMSLGLSYKSGDAVETDTGVSFPGVLTLGMSADGTDISLDVNTALSMGTAAEAPYTVNGEAIDLTEADDETMTALSNSFMSVLTNALYSLMGAPGVGDLMQMFGLTE